MAIEPLIDITSVDLANVAISEDEVGNMNPQAGDMRQLTFLTSVKIYKQPLASRM